MSLLLNGSAELEQLVRDGLLSSLEDINQPKELAHYHLSFCCGLINLRSRVALVLSSEEGNSLTRLTGTTSSANSVNVILNRKRKLLN